MKATDRQLLREYVRQVLVEDDGYGGLGMYDAMNSPYGIEFGSKTQLYNIFIKPFTDVVATAAGKTKELSQKAQTIVRVAYESVMTTLLPGLSDSYEKIFAKEKDKLEKIRTEYGDVYQSNWDAFKDNDVLLAAFGYAPALFVTAVFANKSPKIAAKMMSVLSGGTLDPWLKKVSHRLGWDRKSKANADVTGRGLPLEGLMREEKKPADAASLLNNKKAIDVINNSTMTQQLSKACRSAVQETLQHVYEQAKAATSAKTLDDLRKISPKIDVNQFQQLPEKERRTTEQLVLQAAKKTAKTFYVKNLEAHVKKALAAGVPNDHPYVADFQKVIAKINAL